jgi:hypothetical protein
MSFDNIRSHDKVFDPDYKWSFVDWPSDDEEWDCGHTLNFSLQWQQKFV